MEPGPLRRLIVMATMAVMAMLVMYLFMAKSMTDTDVPQVRNFVVGALSRSLDPEFESSLRVRRLSRGLDAPRHYELVIAPSAAVAADARAIDKLLARAAMHVLVEVKKGRGPASVTCVAVLPSDGSPGGSERRLTFDATLRPMEEPPAPAPTEE